MSAYIQHDAAGNITAVINSQLPEDGIEVDETVAAGISPATHYISNGAVIAYTETQIQAKSVRPLRAVSWNNATMAWDLPANVAELQAADAMSAVQHKRAALLTETDWMVVRAMESGAAVPVPWAAYRQALRDVTLQPGYPLSVNWPERPEGS